MIILAIETSCDDTAIAVIRSSDKKNPRFEILSNIVSSQVKLHKKYGGVYPTLAKREHQRNLVPVLEKALKGAEMLKIFNSQFPISNFQTLEKILIREKDLFKQLKDFLKKYQKPKVDLIAVTNGPGLEPCLWIGINFAKALAFAWNLPIVPVNHIEAHILVNFVNKNLKSKCQISNFTRPNFAKQKLRRARIQSSNIKNLFPAICLIVSGGHTQLIIMRNFGKYKIIGETRDDAAGECFDKAARILGLEYPGGPAIAAAASAAKPQTTNHKPQTKLPRPMIHQKNYDFSFSGLKTAVLYDYKKQDKKTQKSQKYVQEMCKEIQQAIIDVLIKKTIKAAKDFKVKSIILGGGVTANKELRKQLEEKIKKEISDIQYLIPDIKLATDNAVMVAITGCFHKPEKIEKIKAKANLRLK